MSDILMPKNQALVERLRRRFEKYRSRHEDCVPRFEHTTNGLNDQHKQETLLLRQKYLESKAKKSAKKSDKSNKHHHNNSNASLNSNNQSHGHQQDGNGNSSMGPSRLQKRPCEDSEMGSSSIGNSNSSGGGGCGGGSGENYEPPTKMPMCGPTMNGRTSASGLTFTKPKHKSSGGMSKSDNSNSSSNNNKGNSSNKSSSSNTNNSSSNSCSSSNNSLTKFSLEIVHQVELTSGNGANSMPNVTVKTSTNTNVKTGRGNNTNAPTMSSTCSTTTSTTTSSTTHHNNNSNNSSNGQSTNINNVSSPVNNNNNNNNSTCSSNSSLNPNSTTTSYTSSNTLNIELKQESSGSILNSSEFADLDECAAALEKDAANSGGSSMIASLIGLNGDGVPEGMIPSDTLKDLISEISDLNPDFMGDFDFDDDRSMEMSSGISILANSLNSSIQPSTAPSSNNGNHSNHGSIPNNPYLDNMSQGFGPGNSNSNNHAHHHQQHGSSHHPVAPVTPTATSNNSSPRLGHVKLETEMSSSFSSPSHSIDTSCGNRGLSHCAGPSPAAASTASPLASQLNSHHPSQTPPYCSGSTALFDSMSPSGSLAAAQPHSGSSTPNSSYGPPTRVPTPSSKAGAGGTAATRIPYTSPSVHDSPAAQTLKQMAEQHQHKAQMGMNPSYSKSTPPNSNPSPARSPFNGDSYAPASFNPGSGPGDFVKSNASPVGFPNVRTPTNETSSMMAGITIKQEANSNYFNQQQQHQQQPAVPQNFPNYVDGMNSNSIPKRNSAPQQQHQQQHLVQSQQQQHKVPCGGGGGGGMGMTGAGNGGVMMQGGGPMNPMCNNPRMPTPGMQQQQKSFSSSGPNPHHMHGVSGSNGPPCSTPSHMQHMMGRGGSAAAAVAAANASGHHPSGPNQSGANFPHSNHHYNSSPNGPLPNHASVQMSQSQQMSISQNNSSLQVSASASQQMVMASGGGVTGNEMKVMNPLQQQNMYYRQSPPQQQQSHHPSSHQQQQQLHPSSASSNMPMDPSSSQAAAAPFGPNPNGANPNQQHSQQGQTINFTQQHLRMASNVSPGVNNPSISPVTANPMNTMNRSSSSMMGVVPNNVQGGPNVNPMSVRMSMPNRMSTGQGGIVEMGMNPRASMEMQQRMMMRHMHMRGSTTMQQQQMSMMRTAGPGVDYGSPVQEMMSVNSQGMMGPTPTPNMMARFPSNPVGRPPLNNSNRLSHHQQSAMYQQQQMQQQQSTMVPGGAGPRNPMVQPNTMNMSARRMSSMHPNSGVVPSGGGTAGMGSGSRESMAFMSSQQQVQMVMSPNNVPSGVSPHEWVSMQQQQHEQQQHGMSRGFNMQQQQQSMRAGHGNAGFRSGGPGMPMQMSQQQMMAQMGSGAGSSPNGPLAPNSSQCFSAQHQHLAMSNAKNPNSANQFFSQQQQQANMNMKMAQSQMMCMSSSSVPTGNPYMNPSSNNHNGNNLNMIGNGSGGAMGQTPHQMLHPSNSAGHHMSQQGQQQMMNFQQSQNPTMKTDPSDFNFDLDGIGNDSSDFINSYDASSNYQNILDNL